MATRYVTNSQTHLNVNDTPVHHNTLITFTQLRSLCIAGVFAIKQDALHSYSYVLHAMTQLEALTLSPLICINFTSVYKGCLRTLCIEDNTYMNDGFLSVMTSLTDLNIAGCAQISYWALQPLTNLRRLNIKHTHINPSMLHKLPVLTSLVINSTRHNLSHLTNLLDLVVGPGNETHVYHPYPTQLMSLDVRNCPRYVDLTAFTRLEHLAMNNRSDITFCAGNTALTSLVAVNCSWRDYANINSLTSLRSLAITSFGPVNICGLTQLDTLMFNGHGISTRKSEHLANLFRVV